MQEKHQRPALYSPEWWLVWKKGIADQKRAKDKEQVPIVEAVIRRHYPAQVAPTTAGSSSTVGGAARGGSKISLSFLCLLALYPLPFARCPLPGGGSYFMQRNSRSPSTGPAGPDGPVARDMTN